MLLKIRFLAGVLGPAALTGPAHASFLESRSKASKQITSNACVDIDNRDPFNIKFGFPVWKTPDDPNCASKYKLDRNGYCFKAMSPENDCKSFCQLSHGWFYGEPIDAMDGRYCQVGQNCAREVGISKQNGDSTIITSSESYMDATTKSNASTDDKRIAVDLSLAIELGLQEAASSVLLFPFKFKPEHKQAWEGQMIKGNHQEWNQMVRQERSFNILNQTKYEILVSESFVEARPAWSQAYCGSWFVVPIVGISCGRGTNGKLAVNKGLKEAKCFVENPDLDIFSHCFAYTFNDFRQPGLTKYRDVFVLRDCADGFILPGEFQEPAFRHSFSPEVYTRQHIERYGYSNLPLDWPEKPDDADWISTYGFYDFTKEIGPEIHNFKYCGKGGYCVRHKLTDGNCYNIPRGYSGIKSVDVQSVETTGNTCCTLFSRAECHGQAQNVRGKLTAKMLAAVGFLSQAHSVVCGVEEYCNPYVIDTLE